mgnify:CR=1 FL=1
MKRKYALRLEFVLLIGDTGTMPLHRQQEKYRYLLQGRP